MGTFLVFLAGILFLAGIIFLKKRAKQDSNWKTALIWVLYVLWYAIAGLGVSFIYINSRVGHIKATSTAIFLFLGLAVVLAVIIARITGLIRNQPKNPSSSIEV